MVIGATWRGEDSSTARVFVRTLIARPYALGCEKRTQRVYVQRIITPRHLHESEHESFWRDRRGKTLSAPCWHGEEDPKGYRKVKLRTRFPSLHYLVELCGELGYTWSAAGAALTRAHNPWMHPHSDKRRNVCPDLGEIEGNGFSVNDTGYRPQYDKHYGSKEYVDPDHPYVPMAPARRTLVGGGIPMIQVMREIAKHRWDDVTSSSVLGIVYRRESPSELSEKHGIPLRRLKEYARQIRKAIKGDPLNVFAQ